MRIGEVLGNALLLCFSVFIVRLDSGKNQLMVFPNSFVELDKKDFAVAYESHGLFLKHKNIAIEAAEQLTVKFMAKA